MKTVVALLLCCWLSFSCFAQPGAFGGSLRFRLFDAQGRLVGPGRSGYACFPSWEPADSDSEVTQHPERYPFAHKFSWATDGYWRYESIPTPSGGIIPSDITINVVHGRDTMHIRGLDHFSFGDGVRVDSIPFSPGHFTVPEAYVALLNVRSGKGRIANIGWEFFRGTTARPAPIATERVGLRSAAPGKELTGAQSSCARLSTSYSRATRSTAVYLADSLGRNPKLLFHNLGTEIVSCACSHNTLALLLAGGEVVLKSDDAGITWRAYQVWEAGTWWQQYHLQPNPVRLEWVWLEGNQVLAAGARSSASYYLPGIFQLHFDPGTASEAYRRSNDKAREDLLAEMQRQKNVLLQNIRVRRRQAENRPYPHRAFPATVAFVQLSHGDGRRTVMLVLQNGRFWYYGYRWPAGVTRLTDGTPYDSDGTYALTDSTITFREQPETRPKPTDITSFYLNFTYHYYFTRSRESYFIHLSRWDDEYHYEDSTSFYPQQ